MDYTILTIRTPDEDDARLYPSVTEGGTVALEQWDGEPLRITGSGLSVEELVAGGWKTRMRLKDVKLEILITDSRFAVSCRKFDKGGGWWGIGAGGAAFALAANGVSK